MIRLLAHHPHARMVGGTSRTWAGKTARELFPFLTPELDFPLSAMDDLQHLPEAELAFLALPHGEAAQVASHLLDKGLKVVDLSADLRLNQMELYEEWYGTHHMPHLLPRAVYGLPEIHRKAIRNADLIANPGCYPTTVILGLAPLFPVAEVDTSNPVVDAKSGISGAGRGAKLITSFCEAGEGFKPYGVLRHRHIPEMEQELSKLAGKPIRVRFTPHLIPAIRGMVSTIYVPARSQISSSALREAYRELYRDEPFMRVLGPGQYPDTAMVRGSNQCHIAVEVDDRTSWVIVMVAIDNLVKGASGQAIQNMNVMMGFEETAGLTGLPMFP